MSLGKPFAFAALGTAFVLTGCSDGSGPSSGPTQRINLMVGAAAPAQPGAATSQTITVGAHELVLDKVELVFNKIRLKRVEGSACPDVSASNDSGSDDHGGQSGEDDDERHDEPRNDRCEKFITGPLLVDLPLDGQVKKLISVDVDTGTYRRVDFRIHKVSDDPEDAAFLADHPDLHRISVRVTGTFDGTAFTYTADVTAKQKSRLDPPLVVTTAGATDLTFSVDVSNWFVSGGQLIDPTDAGPGKPAAQQIRQNIIRSFHLFKDHDHDGKEDHDH
jgi:hypothetical protein